MEEAMKIDFGSLFSRAWNITWNHKILWIFGFLAMLGGGSSGGGGGSNGGGSGNSFRTNSTNFPRTSGFGDGSGLPPAVNDFINQLVHIDTTTIVLIVVGVCLCLLVLWLAIQILAILGTGGLIGGIDRVDVNHKVTFGEAWAIGRRYFWRLLLLRLLRFGVGIALAIVLLIPMICCCPLGIVLSILMGFIIAYAFSFMDISVVIEDKGVGESINRAYTILRDNLGATIIVALILFAISLGIGIASLLLLVPFGGFMVASLWPVFTSTGAVIMPLLITAIVFLVLGVAACMLVEAVWTTYRTAVIVLAFKHFAANPAMIEGVARDPIAPPSIPTTI
jgi:hypothetical protein